MRSFAVVAIAALAAVAQAKGHASNQTYVTEVVTQLTTYCPEATQITHNGQTYTITEATTLTITNCPCTVTKPVYSSAVTACSTCSSSYVAPTAPAYTKPSSPAAPVYPTPSKSVPIVAPYPPANGTVSKPPAGTAPGYPGSPTASVPVPPAYTGAASKVSFGAAGALAALGLVAAL